ncbi:hypothetical protein F5146DRAFT_1002315 [Armillaria mellea]|nr:hypothetical protein F5146DRAFT_1002315 [Armillaria mellea]
MLNVVSLEGGLCIGPGPTGSIVFLMPLESVDLASFDVSLGTDVFTYYNKVLVSMTATAARDMEDHGDEMDIDLPSSFGGQNNDGAMDRFQILDHDYPVDVLGNVSDTKVLLTLAGWVRHN